MNIAVDKNQFSGSHGLSNASKHIQMEMELGHILVPIPLPFGDYCQITDEMQETIERRGSKLKKQDLVGDIKVSVDTKKDLLEVCNNICSGAHSRFRDEAILAQKCGCKLYVLVEEKGISSVRDVFSWQNPRTERYNRVKSMQQHGKGQHLKLAKAPPTNGQTLAKAMLTMEKKYGLEFVFCNPKETGVKIVELLLAENKDYEPKIN